jgi:hypothetical protein
LLFMISTSTVAALCKPRRSEMQNVRSLHSCRRRVLCSVIMAQQHCDS